MKLRTKRIVALAAAAFVLLVGIYCLLRFGFSVDVLDRSGWSTRGDAVRYLDYFGRPQLKWQYIDNRLYYFSPDDGNMVTGWQTVDGHTYYFGNDGVRASGWIQVDGKTFYLGADGKAVTGKQTIDKETYYFSHNGQMATGWQTVDGKRYYFSPEGKTVSGMQTVDGKHYCFAQDGQVLTGWVTLDGARYCFAEDGAAVTGWLEEADGKVFLDETGRVHTGWLDWEGKRYYFDDAGKMTTGWLTLEQDRYYLREDGVMAVGEMKIDGETHFFTSTGKKLLVVNVKNPVPADYQLDLVDIEGFEIDRSCRDALENMLIACRNAGYVCKINNTYRFKATQQYMWNKSVSKYMADGMTYEQACAETGKDTMPAGHSEHQTGLAVDITGSQLMYQWLAENCWDYGFILRYPQDHTSATGIIYEPWHFRYVGTELSLELEELGFCLEEYMANLTNKTE